MSKNLVPCCLGIFALVIFGIQAAEAEVWIPEHEYTAFIDSSGQFTVIGNVKNTEDYSIIPTITIKIADGEKIISETYEHLPIIPSGEMPFKIKFPKLSSKSPILLEPEISYASAEKTPIDIKVIYDETLVTHEDGHLTGRIINNGESTIYDVKVFAIIHGYDKVLDVGQNIEKIEKIGPGEIQSFTMYPDPSIESEIHYYSCFVIGDSSIVTLNAKRNDEIFTIRFDSGLQLSYPEFDNEGKNLHLAVLGGWPLADYANLEFPISSTDEKFEVYFNDEKIHSIQSIDEMATWHVAFNLPPQSQGEIMISGFEEPDESISDKLAQNKFLKDVELSSDVQIMVFNPPLKQLKLGIEPENVVCKEGLELIIKSNESPACVGLETAKKLEKRGWGIIST